MMGGNNVRLAHEVGEAGAKRRRGSCHRTSTLTRLTASADLSHFVGEVYRGSALTRLRLAMGV